MIGFSSRLLVTNIFTHINNNLFSVLLGRYYSEKEVGQFNQANKWNLMGHSLISGMVNSVALPVLRQVSDDKERQRRVFRKMLRFTSFVSFPAMFGFSLIAPELITIAITDKWLPSAHILQLLAVGGAFIPLTNLYTNLIVSKGKSGLFMWNTIIQGLTQLVVMYLLYPYGIRIMLTVYIIINVGWLLIWHYFVWREIRLSIFSALKDILSFGLIAAAVMTAVHFLTAFIQDIYLLISAKIVSASLLYLLIMAGVTYLIRMVPLVLLKKEITNTWVKSFLYYVPYVTLAVMTFPAILEATDSPASGAAALAAAVILAYRGKSLIQVAAAACAVVFVLELFLVR